MSDGGAGNDLDDDGDSQEGSGAMVTKEGFEDELDENGDVDWQVLIGRLGLKKDRFRSATKAVLRPTARVTNSAARRFKPSYMSFALLLARFALPHLCLIGFFAAIYNTSVSTAREASDLLDVAVITEFLETEVLDVVATVSDERQRMKPTDVTQLCK